MKFSEKFDCLKRKIEGLFEQYDIDSSSEKQEIDTLLADLYEMAVSGQVDPKHKEHQQPFDLAEQFRQSMEAFDHLVFMIRLPENELIYTNRVAEKLFGQKADSYRALLELLFKFVHPQDTLRVNRAYKTLYHSGTFHEVYRVKTNKEQPEKWIKVDLSLQYDDLGSPILMQGMLSDVSQLKQHEYRLQKTNDMLERDLLMRNRQLKAGYAVLKKEFMRRKKSDEERKKAEQKFKALFDQSFYTIALLSPEGRFKELNNTSYERFSFRKSNPAGNYLWDMSRNRSTLWIDSLKEYVAQARQGKLVRYNSVVLSPQNTPLTMDFLLKPIFDDQGKVILLVLEGRDISEQEKMTQNLKEEIERHRQTQRELCQRNRELESLIEHAPDSVIRYDRALRITYINKAAQNYFSVKSTNVIGVNLKDLDLSEEIYKRMVSDYHKVFESGLERMVEYEFMDKKILQVRIVPEYDRQGRLSSILCLGRDITQRVEAEKALDRHNKTLDEQIKERKEELIKKNKFLNQEVARRLILEKHFKKLQGQFRQALEVGNLAWWELNCLKEEFVVSTNKFKMLGFGRPSKLIKRQAMNEVLQEVHPQDVDLFKKTVGQLCLGEIKQYEIEYRMKDRADVWHWFKDTAQVVEWDATSGSHRIMGVIMKILPQTDKANRELPEQHEPLVQESLQENKTKSLLEEAIPDKEEDDQMSILVQTLPDLLCLHDHRGYYTYVSPAIEGFGYSPEDLLDRNPLRQVCIDDLEQLKEQSRSFLGASENPLRFKYRFLGKSGKKTWVESIVKPLFDSNKERVGFVSSTRNIDWQVVSNIEQTLKKTKELNRLKSVFISTASHQFRTPLTTIQSSIELLQIYTESVDESIKPSLMKHFIRILDEINRMNELMNGILQIGRLDSKRMSFSLQELDIVRLCRHILAQHFEYYGFGRRVVFEVVGEPAPLEADENLISQVIVNLLENAFKYSDGDPVLQLVFLGDSVQIVIRDNGIGIPKDEQIHLFESFFRASNVSHIQGTGLGLAIIKDYVAMHQGHISFKSRENEGTEFVIELPLKSTELKD